MKKHFLYAWIILSVPLSSGWANSLPFEELWRRVYLNSPELAANRAEQESNDLARDRGSRHWLPRAYISGQWFNTNDPGQVFLNHLGQRAVTPNDFIPSNLNRPGNKVFAAGVLGLDLPLYEGGLKQSQASMLATIAQASKYETKAKQTEMYSELSKNYGTMILNTHSLMALSKLQKNISKIINNYQVGEKNNPVGYSGLLGLRGVENRIKGMVSEYASQINSSKMWISIKSNLIEDWSLEPGQSLQNFILEALDSTSEDSYSSLILANELKANSLNYIPKMERAHYLPKIGLFAQNNIYSGDRDSEQSQSFGVYIMWELFNPDFYGKVAEAQAKSRVAGANITAAKQKELVALTQLLESQKMLEKILIIITENDRILQEQSFNSIKLFQSGMLTALQLSEVINRRVDLIQNKNKVESQYLEIRTQLNQIRN